VELATPAGTPDRECAHDCLWTRPGAAVDSVNNSHRASAPAPGEAPGLEGPGLRVRVGGWREPEGPGRKRERDAVDEG
jgi:hypothetical protein